MLRLVIYKFRGNLWLHENESKASLEVNIFFFLSFVFLGPCPLHMEVPRLGVQLDPIPQPQQSQIPAMSATYTAAHSNAGSLTH